jgi:hypothetical protein
MAAEATACQNWLHVLIEIKLPSLLMVATDSYGHGERNKGEAATTGKPL